MDFSFGVNGSDAIVNGVESFSTGTLLALTGWLIVLAIVLYLVLCVGAVFSIIGLVRGIKANNKTAIILGGVGAGCADAADYRRLRKEERRQSRWRP